MAIPPGGTTLQALALEEGHDLPIEQYRCGDRVMRRRLAWPGEPGRHRAPGRDGHEGLFTSNCSPPCRRPPSLPRLRLTRSAEFSRLKHYPCEGLASRGCERSVIVGRSTVRTTAVDYHQSLACCAAPADCVAANSRYLPQRGSDSSREIVLGRARAARRPGRTA